MSIEHRRGVQLASRLDASRSELEWAVEAYCRSFAAVVLGAGAVTDALGAKRAFVAGLLVFTAFTAAASSLTASHRRRKREQPQCLSVTCDLRRATS
jgi:DHA2 family methylenomycin A resistance protein-like MFS transporter